MSDIWFSCIFLSLSCFSLVYLSICLCMLRCVYGSACTVLLYFWTLTPLLPVLGRTEELDACVFPTYVAVEPALDEPGGREMVTFVSGETRGPLVSNDVSSRGSTSSCAESSYAVQDAPSVCDERAWSSVGDSSQNSCALVNSVHTSGSSTAVFHGYWLSTLSRICFMLSCIWTWCQMLKISDR